MAEFGKFKDVRDGHVYRTVRIGELVWLAENFRYECAGSAVYGNDKDCLKRCGRLYNWRSALNAAPPGWHLPTRREWNELIEFAGGSKMAGNRLKSRTGWDEKGNGTDEFGFGALPGGFHNSSGSSWDMGMHGHWWSDADEGGRSWCMEMIYLHNSAHWSQSYKTVLYSARYVEG